jgi:hypothetical protein
MIVGMTIDPHGAVTVVSLINSALSSVKAAKDLTKQSKDSDLKEQISGIYDAILNMKERVLELDEENRNLREQLEQRAAIKRSGEFGYFYQEGDADPLCPKCWEGSNKIAHLSAMKQRSSGVRRDCIHCATVFWEKEYSQPQQQRSGNWME